MSSSSQQQQTYLEDALNSQCDEPALVFSKSGNYFQPGLTLMATMIIACVAVLSRRVKKISSTFHQKVHQNKDASSVKLLLSKIVYASQLPIETQSRILMLVRKRAPSEFCQEAFGDNAESFVACVDDHLQFMKYSMLQKGEGCVGCMDRRCCIMKSEHEAQSQGIDLSGIIGKHFPTMSPLLLDILDVFHIAKTVNIVQERKTTLIALFFNVILAITILIDFYSQPWPVGDFVTCQIPYILSIVCFKPFSLPMWACLTVCSHYSFIEIIFGDQVDGLDATGTPLQSPLPRNILTVFLIGVVTLLLCVWFGLAFVFYAYPILVFSPILLIPGLLVPIFSIFFIMYGLDHARGWISSQNGAELLPQMLTSSNGQVKPTNTRGTHSTSTLPPSSYSKVFTSQPKSQGGMNRKGVGSIHLEQYGCDIEVAQPITSRIKAADSQQVSSSQTKVAKEVFTWKIAETVFILKMAATQLLLLFMLAMPLIRIYHSGKGNDQNDDGEGSSQTTFTWTEGKNLILGEFQLNQYSFHDIKVNFGWPNFTAPRYEIQFAVGIGLIATEKLFSMGMSFLDYLESTVWFQVTSRNRNTLGSYICRAFSFISWAPFKTVLDLWRVSLERSIDLTSEIMRSEAPPPWTCANYWPCNKWSVLQNIQKMINNLCKVLHYVQKCVMCFGTISCIAPLFMAFLSPYSKVFDKDATQEDMSEFCKDEASLSYRFVDIRNNKHKCDVECFAQLVHLRRVHLENCSNFHGSTIVFQKMLHLTRLDLSGLHVSFKINLEHFRPLKLLQKVSIGAGIESGDISVFGGMSKLRYLSLSTGHYYGSIRVFQNTPHLETLVFSGHNNGVKGDIAVFRHTRNLRWLEICSSGIHGDVNVLVPLTLLEEVKLSRSKFTASSLVEFEAAKKRWSRWYLELENPLNEEVDFFDALGEEDFQAMGDHGTTPSSPRDLDAMYGDDREQGQEDDTSPCAIQ